MKPKVPLQIRFLQVALLIIALGMGFIGYIFFQPTPNVTVEQPIPLDKNQVGSNEIIKLNVRYCSPPEVTQKVEVQLVDPKRAEASYTIYTIEKPDLKKSCDKAVLEVNTARFKSFQVESGDYRLRLRAVINVNQLKHDVKLFDSEPFKYTKD